MHKQLGIAVIVFLISVFAKAQDINTPKIVFDSTSYNMGIMQKGDKGECIFNFTNKSKSPVIITNVKAACGCTVPNWQKEPVMPGVTSKISVLYNTNLIGPFHKSITVYTNADEKPIVLTIRGEVVKKK